ncbi:Alpha-L-arabinofuranosidase, partial [Claviceps lovelessii]
MPSRPWSLLAAAGCLVGPGLSGPCDIYAGGGTPCVAAHSTTRALYKAYTGPLYQV